jgi:hypothetical protein
VNRTVQKALLVGAISCILGTTAIFGSLYFLIHAAERWAQTQLVNEGLLGLFQSNLFAAIFAVGGVAFAWFAFGFFITYSRLSSKAELQNER